MKVERKIELIQRTSRLVPFTFIIIVGFVASIAFLFWLSYLVFKVMPDLETFLEFQFWFIVGIFLFGGVASLMLSYSIFSFYKLLKLTSNPSQVLLKGVSLSTPPKHIIDKVTNYANQLGVSNVQVYTADDTSLICCLPENNTKSLIFSKNVTNKLDEEELNMILLHEMYHAKYDSFNEIMLRMVTMMGARYHLYLIYAFLLTTLFLSAVMPEGNLLIVDAFDLGKRLSSEPLLLGILIVLFSFLAVLVVLLMKGSTRVKENYIFLREILADSFCCIHTRNPAIVSRTLKKVVMLSLNLPKSPATALNFSPPKMKSVPASMKQIFGTELTSWRSILEWFTGRVTVNEICPLSYRLMLVKFMDRMINKGISVQMENGDVADKLKLLQLPSSIAEVFLHIKKEKFRSFTNYLRANSSNFNLIKCSSYLGMDPFLVFLFFYAFVNRGLIKIENSISKTAK